jgi:hypothetical protein
MDPISIISLASTVIPSISKWLGFGDSKKVKEVADTVSGMAQAITGKNDNKEAFAALAKDPKLLAEMERDWQHYDLSLQGELTARHAADMKSDSWLSKNIRPMVLIAATSTLLAGFFLDGTSINIVNDAGVVFDYNWQPTQWVYEGIQSFAELTAMFYFGSRGVEKTGVRLPFIGK